MTLENNTVCVVCHTSVSCYDKFYLFLCYLESAKLIKNINRSLSARIKLYLKYQSTKTDFPKNRVSWAIELNCFQRKPKYTQNAENCSCLFFNKELAKHALWLVEKGCLRRPWLIFRALYGNGLLCPNVWEFLETKWMLLLAKKQMYIYNVRF